MNPNHTTLICARLTLPERVWILFATVWSELKSVSFSRVVEPIHIIVPGTVYINKSKVLSCPNIRHGVLSWTMLFSDDVAVWRVNVYQETYKL